MGKRRRSRRRGTKWEKKYRRTKEGMEQTLLSRREIDDNGCWLWTGFTRRGYGRIMWKQKVHDVHRVAAHIWLGFDLDSDLWVLHKNDCNRRCFNPNHLHIGTRADNERDLRQRRRN